MGGRKDASGSPRVQNFREHALAWLAATLTRGPLRKMEHRLEETAMRSLLLPAYGCITLLMLCLVPVFKIEESHWIRKHDLIRLEAEYGGTRYEYELAQQLRAELQEASGL